MELNLQPPIWRKEDAVNEGGLRSHQWLVSIRLLLVYLFLIFTIIQFFFCQKRIIDYK